MSKISGSYTFDELVKLDPSNSEPLIENFLYDMDHLLLVGKEKSNKSTLALQICCALSSGEPLFGQFNVPKAVDVVYIQAEGKLDNTRKNVINMTKVIPCDKTRIKLLYYPAIQLNKEEGLNTIIKEIYSWKQPKLIVVDPLYQSMVGKIEEQEASSRMTANLRALSDHFRAAIILVHHAHRAKRDQKGEIVEEGDDSVFGSFVWKAFPDTVLLIQKVQGHRTHRKLSCDTQRMGNVFKELNLMLIEPEPFYLQIKDENMPIDELVHGNIGFEPVTIERLSEIIKKERHYISNSLYRLQHQGRVELTNPGQKPMLWRKFGIQTLVPN